MRARLVLCVAVLAAALAGAFAFSGGTPETTGACSCTSASGVKAGRPGCLRPATTGSNYELTPLLKPLADVKRDITVVSGLHNLIAGVGGHGYTGVALFSAVAPQRIGTSNNWIAGISVDQVAANELGAFTPALPSLAVGNPISSYYRAAARLRKGPTTFAS